MTDQGAMGAGSVGVLIDRLGVVMEEVLAELRHLRSDLVERTASVSSVEIDSNGKAGETKVKVKKYTDSQPPVDEALEDFAFGMREIQRLQMANWAETVDGTRAERLVGEA